MIKFREESTLGVIAIHWSKELWRSAPKNVSIVLDALASLAFFVMLPRLALWLPSRAVLEAMSEEEPKEGAGPAGELGQDIVGELAGADADWDAGACAGADSGADAEADAIAVV